jgi:hypothetical protein
VGKLETDFQAFEQSGTTSVLIFQSMGWSQENLNFSDIRMWVPLAIGFCKMHKKPGGLNIFLSKS